MVLIPFFWSAASQRERIIVAQEIVGRAQRGFDRGQPVIVIESAPDASGRARGTHSDRHRGGAVLDEILYREVIRHSWLPFLELGRWRGADRGGFLARQR